MCVRGEQRMEEGEWELWGGRVVSVYAHTHTLSLSHVHTHTHTRSHTHTHTHSTVGEAN